MIPTENMNPSLEITASAPSAQPVKKYINPAVQAVLDATQGEPEYAVIDKLRDESLKASHMERCFEDKIKAVRAELSKQVLQAARCAGRYMEEEGDCLLSAEFGWAFNKEAMDEFDLHNALPEEDLDEVRAALGFGVMVGMMYSALTGRTLPAVLPVETECAAS